MQSTQFLSQKFPIHLHAAFHTTTIFGHAPYRLFDKNVTNNLYIYLNSIYLSNNICLLLTSSGKCWLV